MKFTKTLASIAAAAIAVSSLAVSAFAADINLGKELNADELALLKDTDTTFVVEYDSPNGWDDIGFGASIDEIGTWASANFKAEVGKGTLTVTVADILKKMGIESLADASYMKVEGYNETTISKVEIKAADAEKPADPGETEVPAEPVAPADVTIANSGRTVVDSGLVRTNIINEWTGNDADVIADKAAFAGANKISVKFTVTNFTTPFKAWIAMADSKWECQFQGEGNEVNANAKCTPVEVTGNGTYVVTIDLDKVIDGVAFIAVCTDLKAAEDDAIPTIAIDQIKINEEITVKPGETTEPTEPGKSDPVKPGDCSGEPVNPPTGAAVAVIPAALAAVAVATTGIVLMKRSK